MRRGGFEEEGIFPHGGEGPADVILKYHDNNENDGAQEVIQDPVHRHQSPHLGDQEREDKQNQADEHLDGAGPTDQENDPIDHRGDDEDIYGIRQQRETGKNLAQPRHASQPSGLIMASTRAVVSLMAGTSWTLTMWAPLSTETA